MITYKIIYSINYLTIPLPTPKYHRKSPIHYLSFNTHPIQLIPQLSLSLTLSRPVNPFLHFFLFPSDFPLAREDLPLNVSARYFPPWRDRALALTITRARPPPLAPAEHHLSSVSPPVRPLTRVVDATHPQPLSLPTEHLPSCS
jgi:hypothetical protein